jgi:hypothetical protein
MAQEEIIFKVGVDTGDSASRVASIDKEFDTLRKSIKDTEQEVDKLSKEFGDNSKQADEAKKKLSNLSQSYKELSKAATDVNAKFEEVYGELQPLTTRLGEAEDRLYELALAGKQNTKEYQDLLETVARYRQTQIETDRVVDSAAQTFTQKLGGAIQGAANGYAVVQGAMGLFGTESKELEEALLKVQSAMALAQGIEGVRTALPLFKDFANTIKTGLVGAFSSLKGAIASTGIGLLVIGIGILISKMMDYFKTTEEIIKQNERLLISNNRIIAQIGKRREKLDEDMNKQLAYAEAMGKSDEDLYNIKKKFSDKSIKANNDEIQTRLDNVKKLKEIDLGQQASSKEQYLELVKTNKQKIVAEWERINELKKINSKANDDVKIAQIKLNNENKEEQKKANEDAINKQKERNAKLKEQREKEAQERLNLQRKLEDLTVANIDDVNTREIMALKLKHDREREELIKQYAGKKALKEKFDALMLEMDIQQEAERVNLKKDQDKTKKDKENLDKRSQLEADIIRAEEDFNLKQQKRIELENLDYEQKKSNTELTNGELELLKLNHERNLNDISQESKDRQIMLDEELANSKKNLQNELFNVFGTIAGLTEENSALQKAYAITQLSIDTAKSISSVIAGATAAAASTGPAAPFVLAGYIASGIATVTNALSTANKILNAPMPSVQPPQQTRPNEQTQTAQQGTQQNIQAQSTYKVVVVDSDITKMQDKTKKVNAISTI